MNDETHRQRRARSVHFAHYAYEKGYNDGRADLRGALIFLLIANLVITAVFDWCAAKFGLPTTDTSWGLWLFKMVVFVAVYGGFKYWRKTR